MTSRSAEPRAARTRRPAGRTRDRLDRHPGPPALRGRREKESPSMPWATGGSSAIAMADDPPVDRFRTWSRPRAGAGRSEQSPMIDRRNSFRAASFFGPNAGGTGLMILPNRATSVALPTPRRATACRVHRLETKVVAISRRDGHTQVWRYAVLFGGGGPKSSFRNGASIGWGGGNGAMSCTLPHLRAPPSSPTMWSSVEATSTC